MAAQAVLVPAVVVIPEDDAGPNQDPCTPRVRPVRRCVPVAALFLLKTGDSGLAHVATDRSMTVALASQDPLTVGASGRIVAHT
jgi:hypothetical protein